MPKMQQRTKLPCKVRFTKRCKRGGGLRFWRLNGILVTVSTAISCVGSCLLSNKILLVDLAASVRGVFVLLIIIIFDICAKNKEN
jgi:hypothetical protein